MAAATLLCSALLAAQPKLAVLDVRPGVGISPELARGLSESLTHEVRRRNPDVDVLGATEIRAMLEVQAERSKLGCQDVSCLVEIGGALGADRIVTAGLNRFGDTYAFTLQLVDVRRARVMRDAEQRFTGNNQGELLSVVEAAVATIFPEEPRSSEAPLNPHPSRISLIYSPEIPIVNGAFGQQDVVHSIGAELSLPSGGGVRYHLQAAYLTVDGLSGLRLEPLTFGWAIPLVSQGRFRLEIEPMISFVDVAMLFNVAVLNTEQGSSNVGLYVSSGVSAQVNLAYGPLYVFLSPLGFELRYFGLVPQENYLFGEDLGTYGESAAGGADLDYRLRVGVGFQY